MAFYMKKIVILILILSLILAGVIFLKAEQNQPYIHSWTKAICTQNNYCEDYEIICEGNNIIGLTPTGASVQFDKDWKDPRDEESRKELC